jgi:drug/metabolite transporter (DMT)-like permease
MCDIAKFDRGAARDDAVQDDNGKGSHNLKQATLVREPDVQEVRPIYAIAAVCLTLCCAMWGLNQVAIKVANTGMSPLFQAGLRCALAAVLVVLWAWWRGTALFEADGSFWPGVAVGALLAGNFMFIGPGLELTDASRGILFLYAAPFLVALGAHTWISGEQLTGLKVVGLLAAFSGLALSTAGRSTGVSGPQQALGDFYCFIGAVFWAASTLVIRTSTLKRITPEKILFYQLVVATPLLFLGAWVLGESGITNPTPNVMIGFVFSTVVVVFVSYLVWFWLLRTYPASEVSVFTFLAPIFGVLSGYVLLNEQVSWSLAGALMLITVGIALVAKPARRVKSPEV